MNEHKTEQEIVIPTEPANSTTEKSQIRNVYIFLGVCLLFGSIIISLGFWFQTRILETRISNLEESLYANLKTAANGPSTDIVTYYQNLPQENLENKPGDVILGSAEAPVTIVVYEDFQCPYCHEFFHSVFPGLKADYIDTGNVKFVHRNFAFLGDESVLAAASSKCATAQNKFWEFHAAVYANQGAENSGIFTKESLQKIATEAGLQSQEFNTCITNNLEKEKEVVTLEKADATKVGVSSTPTMYIDGKKIEGVLEYAELKKIVKYLLENN